MRAILAALVFAACVATSQIGFAQSRMGDSDDYVCNRGDPDAQSTIAACARLRAYVPNDEQAAAANEPVAAGENVPDNSAQAPPAAMVPEPSAAPTVSQDLTPPASNDAAIPASPDASVPVMDWIYLGIVVVIALAIYFLPTTTAIRRKNHQVAAIFVLNLCLGWTLIGWVSALVWAYVKPSPNQS